MWRSLRHQHEGALPGLDVATANAPFVWALETSSRMLTTPRRGTPCARRAIDPRDTLGGHRHGGERSLAWLVGYRRLQVRNQRRTDLLLGFLYDMACALIRLESLNGLKYEMRSNRKKLGPPYHVGFFSPRGSRGRSRRRVLPLLGAVRVAA